MKRTRSGSIRDVIAARAAADPGGICPARIPPAASELASCSQQDSRTAAADRLLLAREI